MSENINTDSKTADQDLIFKAYQRDLLSKLDRITINIKNGKITKLELVLDELLEDVNQTLAEK